MADSVRIPEEVIAGIAGHARRALPDECCGLLVGRDGVVHRAVPAKNLTPSPTGYQIDPADHFVAIRTARAEGREVIGAYHSHPGAPAVPSRRDLAEAWYPGFVYLIMSVGPEGTCRDVQAYRLTPGGAVPVTLVRASLAEGIAAREPDDG